MHKEGCLHQLFEAQAARTPDAIAVCHHDEEVSFAELNQRANRLAHYLRSQGAGPEVRIGVMMPRTIEMIASLLAISKSGAAYVPLDPQYPRERLEFMVADSAASMLVTRQSLAEALPSGSKACVYVDNSELFVAAQTENPLCATLAGNLAYVIYTSGSTGRPKGVGITHRSVVSFLEWAREVFSPAELGGLLATTSICFDLSIFELFAPLSWGGTVVLAENALSLSDLETADRVKLINTVPSALTEIVRQGLLPESVCTINLAGEPLPKSLVQRIYDHPNVRRVLNLYGPSEDTTYSTMAEMVKGSTDTPTIGRPISNKETYILSPDLQAVPQGIDGELLIGGAGLARGYLNRPELTAERFVPHPFSAEPGARLYRTGDRARLQNNGDIEFLGRLDHQVKLRGFRIELGEIEAALREDRKLSEAIVLVGGENGDRQLVAYVVAETRLTNAEIRQRLQQKLPDYMVPNAYVQLDRLPLTANGKVDRRALAGINPGPDTDCRRYVAARTPVEEVLTMMWREVLGVERVGVHDNFFELGGHSLKAAQVISRVRATFHFQMDLRQFLNMPTVAELSNYLLENEKCKGQVTLIAEMKTRIARMTPEEVRVVLRDKKRARG